MKIAAARTDSLRQVDLERRVEECLQSRPALPRTPPGADAPPRGNKCSWLRPGGRRFLGRPGGLLHSGRALREASRECKADRRIVSRHPPVFGRIVLLPVTAQHRLDFARGYGQRMPRPDRPIDARVQQLSQDRQEIGDRLLQPAARPLAHTPRSGLERLETKPVRFGASP